MVYLDGPAALPPLANPRLSTYAHVASVNAAAVRIGSNATVDLGSTDLDLCRRAMQGNMRAIWEVAGTDGHNRYLHTQVLRLVPGAGEHIEAVVQILPTSSFQLTDPEVTCAVIDIDPVTGDSALECHRIGMAVVTDVNPETHGTFGTPTGGSVAVTDQPIAVVELRTDFSVYYWAVSGAHAYETNQVVQIRLRPDGTLVQR